jgi:hypothetical protein
MTNPAQSARIYGTPQQATEQIAATLRDVLGDANHDGDTFTIAETGSRCVIDSFAAAIAHDLITSGAMSPAIPDFIPPE